jgi:hypothetical protein
MIIAKQRTCPTVKFDDGVTVMKPKRAASGAVRLGIDLADAKPVSKVTKTNAACMANINDKLRV